jgi:hypothetical protein
MWKRRDMDRGAAMNITRRFRRFLRAASKSVLGEVPGRSPGLEEHDWQLVEAVELIAGVWNELSPGPILRARRRPTQDQIDADRYSGRVPISRWLGQGSRKA